MKHCGTKRIDTETLVLRKLEENDAKAMFENWASDPQVTKYLTWPTHTDIEVTKVVLADWLVNYTDDKFYQWCIAFKDNIEEPIGSISVVDIKEDVNSVEIGYCIGRRWWNKGITTEALKGVIDFFFTQTDAQRVMARHHPQNIYSGRVMQSRGMTYEGTVRNYDVCNQGVCDVSYYGILKTEWNRK